MGRVEQMGGDAQHQRVEERPSQAASVALDGRAGRQDHAEGEPRHDDRGDAEPSIEPTLTQPLIHHPEKKPAASATKTQ